MKVLAHREEGSGPPLLLLNGGMMSFSAWGGFAEALAASYRVVRCDLRGQLLSPGAPPETLDGHVADVTDLLDHLGVAKAHVLGTSFGAEVALYLAALRPERVASLLAVTAVDRFTPEMLAEGEPLADACRAAAAGGDRERVYDLLVEGTFTPAWARAHSAELAARRAQVGALPVSWFEGLSGLLASLATLDLAPHLGAVRCPTLVVAAEHDRIMPLERTRAVADGIAGTRLETVAGSGHAVLLERPGALLPLCAGFLEGVRG